MSKISELSDGGVIQSGDYIPVIRSGGTIKTRITSLENIPIGSTTPSTGAFTDLTASGIKIESSNAGTSAGPGLVLYRNSSSPADSDSLGNITFEGKNDAGQDVAYALISSFIKDASDGTEDGQFTINTILNGVSKQRIKGDDTELVINEQGENFDFRVESDSLTHALYVDAGNNQVLVGASVAPTSTLFYVESAAFPAQFRSTNASVNYAPIVVRNNYATGGQTAKQIQFNNGAGTEVGTIKSTASATSFNTSSDQRLKENIVDAPSASDDIDAIQVRSFDWKANNAHQKYGLVAQELLTVAPDAVAQGDTEEDMMGVDYSKLVPMLIKEIQSLRNRAAELEGG